MINNLGNKFTIWYNIKLNLLNSIKTYRLLMGKFTKDI